MANKTGKTKANANPTRVFFAQMLAKDITLRAAIFDLIDNSLDGARRIRGKDSLKGLWIDITARKNRFVIEDNCGGIPITIARHYAFRFGRTEKAQEILDFEHATGQFGVGMKRALFKLGKAFEIESRSDEGKFSMKEDVLKWVADEADDWSFGLNVASVEAQPKAGRGTRIVIAPLHQSIAEDFAMDDFRRSLRRELGKRYVVPLEEGLEIKVNGARIKAQTPKVLVSSALAPTVRVVTMDKFGRDLGEEGEGTITLRLICGVARIEAPDAGWSVGLNSRMVLLDDKTGASGWGWTNGSSIPSWHNQYGRLRGVALLDSDQTTDLPWNTTKTQLDQDHAVYRRIRREMVSAMGPVVTFLNRVKREVDEAKKADSEPSEQPFHRLMTAAKEASAIGTLLDPTPHDFEIPPKRRGTPEKTTTSIQFEMDKDRVRLAKRELRVRANWEVGEETFDFWWRAHFD